jgi:hypothetical protein
LLADWLAGWLVSWLVGYLVNWLFPWLLASLFVCLFVCLSVNDTQAGKGNFTPVPNKLFLSDCTAVAVYTVVPSPTTFQRQILVPSSVFVLRRSSNQ